MKYKIGLLGKAADGIMGGLPAMTLISISYHVYNLDSYEDYLQVPEQRLHEGESVGYI